MLLAGKRAVVSGVANPKSIAWGIAQAMHREGAQLALTCVESAKRRVAKLADELGVDRIYTCDATDDADVAKAFEQIGEAFGGQLDILVHSIAYARLEDLGGEFLRVNKEGWRTALEASAYSLVAMARAARPLMVAAGGGSVMTVSFNGGHKIVPSYNIMGVAKAALECAMRYLAYDLGPDRIRVNAISSGPIATVSSTVVDNFEEALRQVKRITPLLECVSPADVGNLAVFLGSDLSRMITATTIYVDSGADALSAGAGDHPRLKLKQSA
jgi:enoyl-[acyl-carrier protein] reductase I